jgi:predicted Zn finger-like uncharacterized protein
MKFVCKHCDSKYTIADEKVRSKVLKIRCKSCGKIIEVRDPALNTKSVPPGSAKESGTKKLVSTSKKSSARSKDPSALEGKFAESFRKDGDKAKGTPGLFDAVKHSAEVLEKHETDRAHWFVAINDTPVGPVSARKVHGYQKKGSVNDDSMVWKEGMADWTSMRNCKDLVGLLARVDIESTSSEKSQQPSDQPKRGLFSEDKADVSAESPLKGHSIGLIADRIDSMVDEEGSQGSEAGGGADEPSITDDFFGAGEDSAKDGFDSDLQSGLSGLHSLEPPRPVKNQNRVIMFAAVGFFVVAIVTLGVVLFGGGSESGGLETVKTVEKIVEKVVYRDRYIEKPSTRRDDDSQDKSGENTQVASKNSKGRRPKASAQGTEKKVDDKTRALMERMGMSGPGSAPIRGPSKTKDTKSSGGNGPLTANQLKGVVNRNKQQLKSCYERALKQGEAPADKDLRVNFKIKVSGSGMVKNANIGGDGARVTSLKNCLSRSVKKWVFPSSSGGSDLEFPFVFTPR